MNKLVVFMAAAAMFVVGCKPNDSHVKTVKQRLDAGEVIWFSESGSKVPNCESGADWLAIRGTPNAEQERVVLGKQRSLVSPGHRPCYRIGSNVDLVGDKPHLGTVTIQAIGLARLDFLHASDLKGRYFAESSEFNSMKKTLTTRMGGNEQGYVYILNVGYLANSAVNEKAIKEEDKKDGYEETTEDGKGLDACNSWTSFIIDSQFLNPIMDGKLLSYYQLGDMNCVAQGATVELKDKLDPAAPVLAKVKIKKVKRFKMWALAEKHIHTNGFDYQILKNHILDANKIKNAEYMTVIDFDVVPTTPVALARNCPRAINLTRPLKGEVRIDQDAARCAHRGYLTAVVTVNDGGSLAIPVRVKSRIDDPQSSTVVLELERIDQVQGEQP